MRKILIIAKRDYVEVVLTKAYLVGLFIVPVIAGIALFFVTLQNRSAAKEQVIAVIDHTGVAARAVIQACEDANRRGFLNGAGALQRIPAFRFEEVKPSADESEQMLDLSQQIRAGELSLVLDISPEALHPPEKPTRDLVRFYSNSALNQTTFWLPTAVNAGLRRVRLEQLGVDAARIPEVLTEVPLTPMNLATRDSQTGAIAGAQRSNPVQAAAVPTVLFMIMLMVTMLGSAPQIGAIAEGKMQRVFEMLLSSATPLELMYGKVLGSLAVAMTTSVLYVAVGLLALAAMALFGFAPLWLLPWLFAYLIVSVLIQSATGVAIGSACSTPQDAQSLAFLLVLPIMLPVFMLTPVMMQPNGTFATVMSLIPPFTPFLMILRQAMPAGVPWWQPWLGLVGTVAWAAFIGWAAARIFRIGILAQGKVPKVSELVQWVVRG